MGTPRKHHIKICHVFVLGLKQSYKVVYQQWKTVKNLSERWIPPETL